MIESWVYRIIDGPCNEFGLDEVVDRALATDGDSLGGIRLWYAYMRVRCGADDKYNIKTKRIIANVSNWSRLIIEGP